MCNYRGMTKPDLDQLLTEKGFNRAHLIEACGVDKSTVSRWVDRGIPLSRVFQVESATGISREKLRPDFFAEAAQ